MVSKNGRNSEDFKDDFLLSEILQFTSLLLLHFSLLSFLSFKDGIMIELPFIT